jgi:Flp pilus assembly protein TadG
MRRSISRLLQSHDGTTSLEFAVIAPVFLMLLLGIPAAGFLIWAKGAIGLAASQTARCMAIRSTDCTDRTAAYAALILADWGIASLISPISVTFQLNVTCNRPESAGLFSSVTITSATSIGPSFVAPLSNLMLTATACYPMKA